MQVRSVTASCMIDEAFRNAALIADHACTLAGLQPTMRCPCCKAAVHDSAFHEEDKRVLQRPLLPGNPCLHDTSWECICLTR